MNDHYDSTENMDDQSTTKPTTGFKEFGSNYRDKTMLKECKPQLVHSRTKYSEAEIERKVAQLASLEGFGSNHNLN
jgi:hypothetical protein